MIVRLVCPRNCEGWEAVTEVTEDALKSAIDACMAHLVTEHWSTLEVARQYVMRKEAGALT